MARNDTAANMTHSKSNMTPPTVNVQQGHDVTAHTASHRFRGVLVDEQPVSPRLRACNQVRKAIWGA